MADTPDPTPPQPAPPEAAPPEAAPPEAAPPPAWSPSTKLAVAVGLAVFGVLLLYIARGALTLVALSAVLAFLVAPLVRGLNGRLRLPRALALSIGYLMVLIAVLLIGVVVATGVFNSVREIDPPEAVETLRSSTVDFLNNIEEVTLFGYNFDLREVVTPLKDSLDSTGNTNGDTSGNTSNDSNGSNTVSTGGTGGGTGNTTGTGGTNNTSGGSTNSGNGGNSDSSSTGTTGNDSSGGTGSTDESQTVLTDQRATIILGRDQFNLLAGSAVDSLRTVGGLVVALLLSALVTLLVSVYLSADSHKFSRSLTRYVPVGYEGDVRQLSDRINRIWRGYLYGQLLNSLATGLLVWLVLWAIGLPGAFVLGVIMALLNMIPTFGPVLAAVPGVLSAFALGSTRFDISNITFVLVVIVVYLVVVQLQANVMAPFITGKAVRMSPASIIIGLVVGVQVAGLVGAVLVVPTMATGKEIVKYLAARLVDRDPFDPDNDSNDDPDDEPVTGTDDDAMAHTGSGSGGDTVKVGAQDRGTTRSGTDTDGLAVHANDQPAGEPSA